MDGELAKMFIRKYEPRRASPEATRRYYLKYFSNVPDALVGSVMEKESYLDALAAGWLDQEDAIERLYAAA